MLSISPAPSHYGGGSDCNGWEGGKREGGWCGGLKWRSGGQILIQGDLEWASHGC